jgi:hypothetical protein
MTIVDERTIHAPPGICFEVAADVERWPHILPHYLRVEFRAKRGFGTGIVEMAANRDFAGPVYYPTWWLSDMHVDAAEPAVYYTHVGGITRGMIVKWSFEARDSQDSRDAHDSRGAQPEASSQHTHVRITHTWDGPPWPLVGRFLWEHVIARQFVSFIATRTLAGVAAEAERRNSSGKHHHA